LPGGVAPWFSGQMEAHLIKHALRIGASGNDGYHPEGWNPKLRATVMGPTPPGAELVWTMYKRDGSSWFEHSVPLPELADEEMHSASLQKWNSGTDITDEGRARFTLRIVNELDGIDELLHDGAFTISRRQGSNNIFGVDQSSLLTTGLVGFDVYDEHDAPKIRATVFLGGSVDAYEVEAHIFLDGNRFAKASDVGGGYDFTSNDGQSLGREFIAEFDSVRGWNNLTSQGWGDSDWHLLDGHPGHYEIKFTRGGKVNRTMFFDVEDGRIVKDELIEPDEAGRPCMWRITEIIGSFEGDVGEFPDAPRAYGDLDTSTFDFSADGMYWFCNGPAVPTDGPEFDEETAEAVQGVVDTAVRLLSTWESIVTGPIDRQDARSFQFLQQCDAVDRDVDGFEPMTAALSGAGEAHEFEYDDEVITLASAMQRVFALRTAAHRYICGDTDAGENALEPYRAALSNDKLAIFEDHPAPGYRYYTIAKHVIETLTRSPWQRCGSSRSSTMCR